MELSAICHTGRFGATSALDPGRPKRYLLLMKKCPYCGRENEDVALVCQECGQEFEKSAAPDPNQELQDPSLSPVIVGTFNNLQEAKLLADRLEAAGIEAEIPEEFAPQVFSAVISLERVTVRVPAKDYDAAKEIAAEAAIGVAEPDPDTEPEAETTASSVAGSETPEPEPDDPQGRKTCVSCGASIPASAHLCPKCGWTQPDR